MHRTVPRQWKGAAVLDPWANISQATLATSDAVQAIILDEPTIDAEEVS
jgi:hypothetical protein